jgi:hypothetical protein
MLFFSSLFKTARQAIEQVLSGCASLGHSASGESATSTGRKNPVIANICHESYGGVFSPTSIGFLC